MAGGKRRKNRTQSTKKNAPKEEAPKTEGAVSRSLDTFGGYIKKFATSRVAVILLLLIPIFFALFFRIYPATLPVTDQWAENTVQQNVVAQIQQQIRQDFPLLPAAQLQQQALEQYRAYEAQNADEIEAQTTQLSNAYKQRLQLTLNKTDGSTYEQTYFLAIDPYQWLRRAENIIEKGEVCDERRDGVCWNNHNLAPHGGPINNRDFHTWTESFFARAGMLLGYAPMTGAFFLPAVIAALGVIPLFFIVRRKYGNFAGTVAGLVGGLHVVLLGRTPAGFVDTDIWNFFFPLWIAFFLLLALDSKDRKQYLWMAAAGIATALYQRFWSGWFFTFFVLTAVLVGASAYYLARWIGANRNWIKNLQPKKPLENLLRSLKHTGIYIAVSGILISIIDSSSVFISGFTAPLRASTGLQDPIQANLWPNVLTTVAELNTVSLGTIIAQLGGALIFIAATLAILAYTASKRQKDGKYWTGAIVALIYYGFLTTNALAWNPIFWLAMYALPIAVLLLINLVSKEHADIHYELFLVGWMGASVFATTQGTRFLILTVPILAITLGFFSGWFTKTLAEVLHKETKLAKHWGKLIGMAVIIIVLFTPVHANMFERAHQVGLSEVPSMNDAWWASLKAINTDSEPGAIITSWWDFGHWFKYVADRSVNFDGGSQTTPNAHWVGKLLQIDDEQESLAILRMLNCGANDAYDRINAEIKNTRRSYHLTNTIIMQTQDDAVQTLVDEGIAQDVAQSIVAEETHCTPPESYVIVSQDMIGKAGVWGHFATWDFDRAFVYSAYKNYNRERAIQTIATELEVDQTRAAQLYGEVASLQDNNLQASRSRTNAWISPWPGYMGVASCGRTNTTVACRINRRIAEQQGVAIVADTLYVNLETIENATITLTAQGQEVGQITPSELTIDGEYYNLGGDFSMAIRVEGNRATIADSLLVNSLFTRLFYEEDAGEHMQLLTKQTQISGGNILVYKVDWESYISQVEE